MQYGWLQALKRCDDEHEQFPQRNSALTHFIVCVRCVFSL